ncbi:SLBB domain-containing protein [bacterium]|nr:SLBB domain-containing protein [bacterium]
MKHVKIFLVALLLIIPSLIFSQSSSSKRNSQSLQTDLKDEVQSQINAASGSFSFSKDAFEEPINSQKYILGPGDKLLLNIWGEVDQGIPLEVSPESYIVIPSVGRIDAKEMTLADATKKIVEAVSKRYIKAEITVTLISLREIRVSIEGMVKAPGSVTATQALRVSDAISLAGGIWESKSLTQEEIKFYTQKRLQIPNASLRNITVRHKDGTSERVDLAHVQFAKNNDFNPFLRAGDFIFVPQREAEKNAVSIFGAVKLQQENIEFIEGDNLRTLIDFAHGLVTVGNDLKIELVRFEDPVSPKTIELSLSNLDFKLKKDDRVYFRKIEKYNQKYQVWVVGEVKFPGIYSIDEGKTEISEVLQRAGGLTKDGSLAQTTLVRSQFEQVVDPEFERLKNIPVIDMNETEREYFKSKSREINGAVVVDFVNSETFETKEPVILRDKDIVTIGFVRRTVRVTGQVNNPGLVNFEPEKGYKYFISKAGGFTENARKNKVKVIRSKNGVWLDADEIDFLEEGDTVFIPENPERDYYSYFKESLLITSQILAIVVSAILINNQVK